MNVKIKENQQRQALKHRILSLNVLSEIVLSRD